MSFDKDALKKKNKKAKKYKFKCNCGRIMENKNTVYENTSKGMVCVFCYMELIAKRKLESE